MNDLLSQATTPVAPPARAIIPSEYRVMVLAPSSARVAREWMELLCRLRDEGFEVHVLAADDGGMHELRGQGIMTCSLPGAGALWARPFSFAAALILAQAYFITYPPTLIHAVGWQAGALASLATLGLSVPAMILTATDLRWLTDQACGPAHGGPLVVAKTTIMQGLRVRSAPVWGALWKDMGARADAVVVHSAQGKMLLEQLWGTQGPEISVFAGGMGFDPGCALLGPQGSQAQALASLGVRVAAGAQSALWVGVSGQLEEVCEDLAALVASPTLAGISWLIRRPALWSPSRSWAHRRLVTSPRVHWVEGPDKSGLFYQAIDLLLALRYTEEPALSMLEAMASGKAVCASDTHFARGILSDGEQGRLVRTGDGRHVRHVLEEILRDPGELKSWGERARARASELTRAARVWQWLELYDAVLSRKL